MLSTCLRSALQCTLLLAMAAGCSRTQDAEHTTARPEEAARQFSEEERIAARALSISNRSAVQEADSPYAQAVACSRAIEALANRLRQTDALAAEQLEIIVQAKAVYDRRVRTLAGHAETTGETGEDPMQATEDVPEGRRALQAIGCIQRLAQET